ncbi:hypothetical protein Peur_073425 [Populus x canadensis]
MSDCISADPLPAATPQSGLMIEVIYDCSRNQIQHPLCVIQITADSGHCCDKHRAGGGHLRVVLTHVSWVYSRLFLPEKPVNIVKVIINRGFETGHRCDYGGDFGPLSVTGIWLWNESSIMQSLESK